MTRKVGGEDTIGNDDQHHDGLRCLEQVGLLVDAASLTMPVDALPGFTATVTKKEIIEIVAQRTKQRKNHTKVIIECVFDVFIETLARERRIEVRNFGVFRVKETPARIGRNPVTKESADVPARNIVQFKAGKYMKDVVAGLTPVREAEDDDDEEDASMASDSSSVKSRELRGGSLLGAKPRTGGI